MSKLDRKSFLKKTALAAVTIPAIVSACSSESNGGTSDAPAAKASKKYKWKMVTTWPPNFPILGEGAEMFAEWVKEMSGGRLKIKVYGGGELVPPLEAFDAVSSGTVEMSSGASYYWAGKVPAAQFFSSIPFGMNAQQMNAWMISGGGLELWREIYAPFNVIPMLGGNSGVQMGGWFNREINSIADLKGLKMRIPGLGGKVLEKAGVAQQFYLLVVSYIPTSKEGSLTQPNGLDLTTITAWVSTKSPNTTTPQDGTNWEQFWNWASTNKVLKHSPKTFK